MTKTLCTSCDDTGRAECGTVEEHDCELCPRCAICDGLASGHTHALHLECFVEYTKLGWEVLPSERFWKNYVVPAGFPLVWRDCTDAEIPAPRTWALDPRERRTALTCSACGRVGLSACCPGFGVGL